MLEQNFNHLYFIIALINCVDLAFSKLPSSNSEVRCALLNCINKLHGINIKQQILDDLDNIINKWIKGMNKYNSNIYYLQFFFLNYLQIY